MHLRQVIISPAVPTALGATLGQDHMQKNEAELASAAEDDVALILDLNGVKGVNASYLKATVFWAMQCGHAEVQHREPASSDRWAVRPLRLFPAVTGCSDEVASDVDEFFRGRNLAILHVDKRTDDHLVKGRVLGALDPVLELTLNGLLSVGAATAADLSNQSQEKITVSGWSNRLADLHLMRLATRRRDGKFWIYSPTAKQITLWD